MEWFIAYVVVGGILLGVFWKIFGIQWDAEAMDMKLMIVGTPLGWPLVLVFMFLVWIGAFGK